MKKIYLLLSAALIASVGFAQYKVGNGPAVHQTKNLTPKVHQASNNKAFGDSLIYFDSEGFYLTDPADVADFAMSNQDYDGYTNYGNSGWPTPSGDAFQFSFINTDPAQTPYTSPGGDWFPNDNDTAWYIAATSWYTTVLTANNWWNFGPISIPAGTTGNTFSWFDKSNPAWTDSYKLYLVDMSALGDPTAPDGMTDVIGNGLSPVFTHVAYPGSGQPASDTSWTLQSVNVDAFAGSRLFIFFNHQMTDGDVLYLDEMFVTEGTTGIEELNSLAFNVFPNPSTGEFNINLNATHSANVNLSVKNVVGQTVINKTIAVNGKSKETISLANYSKGIYFLTVDNKTTKLIVE